MTRRAFDSADYMKGSKARRLRDAFAWRADIERTHDDSYQVADAADYSPVEITAVLTATKGML